MVTSITVYQGCWPNKKGQNPSAFSLLRPEGTTVTKPRAAAFRRAPWVHGLHMVSRSSRRPFDKPACSDTEIRGTWQARVAGSSAVPSRVAVVDRGLLRARLAETGSQIFIGQFLAPAGHSL
jgi:hypothetical protein